MVENIKKYVRAADYLSAIQIYLQDNVLLREPLKPEHIKSRLLGHWGTCPGINFIYAHLNHLIKQHDLDMLFVLGPGHGFPAIQSNLFLEGTLNRYYESVTRNEAGISDIARKFSWPYGYPSHSNPEAPGVILEGGELGYSLSTAYGAILDNPELIVACMIGDGEAETGPIAGAWHINKIIDPATNGAVLPILHVNGYKISGPTIFGRMNDEELRSLFWGYGYEPHILDTDDGGDIHQKMMDTLETCLGQIRFTQHLAREGTQNEPPRFPMIVLRTPKGWNSIKELNGEKLEGNHLSHQVIASGAKKNPEELHALETWLRSYNFHELFDGENFVPEIESLVPDADHAMGNNKNTMGGGDVYTPLDLPDIREFAKEDTCTGEICSTSMHRAGEFLNKVFELNQDQKNFRLFSPDETYSNRLHKVFETTERAFMWPLESWDKDISRHGRVMEMLSEHNLQGLMQGYVLTGRHGVFASYEAFIQIVASMADQYAKFLHVARDVVWRGDIPSFNYILTSSGWRQDHNGFSHQNPGFVSDMLQRHGCFVNVYFPADENSTLAVLDHVLGSKNEINVIVAGKTPEPKWRTIEEAQDDLREGLRIWDFASDDDPHVVYAGVGDYMTKECLAAIELVKQEVPEIRVRFVNIVSLSAMGMGHTTCRVMQHDMDYYFTKDKPVIFNFHGYPQMIKQILFDYECSTARFTVHGYEESGSTTSPFDMQVRNYTDRYHLAMDGFEKAYAQGLITKDRKNELIVQYEDILEDHKKHITLHGVDPDHIEEWQWEQN